VHAREIAEALKEAHHHGARSGGSVVLSGCGFRVNARRFAVKREAVTKTRLCFTMHRSAFMENWLRFTMTGRAFMENWRRFTMTGREFMKNWFRFTVTGREFMENWSRFTVNRTAFTENWSRFMVIWLREARSLRRSWPSAAQGRAVDLGLKLT
jgi:hypothetical protein